MLTRRHLRIKAMQAVYAYLQVEGDLQQAEKRLLKRAEDIYELYLFLIDLQFEIIEMLRLRTEEAKVKRLPTRDDLNPNTRFVDNKAIQILEKNKMLLDLLSKKKVSWKEEETLVRSVITVILESDELKVYLNKPSVTLEDDKAILLELFEKYIANQPDLQAFFEEKNMYWSDDLNDACWLFVRTITQISERDDENMPLPELFKKTSVQFQDEDREFLIDLFRKTAINATYFQSIISERTQNWDVDRIAQMDVVLMMMALCEFIEFPDIPVKVTLNEYIEIAKEYSTPKSKVFINGVLDKIIVELNMQKKINKSSKGLK